MKTCTRCKVEKSFDNFCRNAKTSSGLHCVCRACQSQANKAWRRANPEKRLEQQRRQNERYLELGGRRTRKPTPLQRTAHQQLRRAVLAGKVVKPNACTACGTTERRIHGHHSDYSKPLQVEWLCTVCHADLHAARAYPAVHAGEGASA
jgi:hypothetical protein